ncbi:MAG: HAD-IC family P-type ATPase [Pirellulales bacterium]
MSNREQETRPWHSETPDEVRTRLDSSPRGLTPAEVERRRRVYGPNLLPEKGPSPLWLIVARQFINPLIYILIAAAAVVIGGLGMLLGHYSLIETFFFVIALIVSAIPEGLPVAMTVALAVATTRMARRNVIVWRLTAVEGLGSCTLIATDKTGTLTCNELTVREVKLKEGMIYQVTGEGFEPKGEMVGNGVAVDCQRDISLAWTLGAAVLCNEADLHYRSDA